MAKKKEEIGFRAAVEEVEKILGRLEADDIDIDDLSAEVRRAVELIGVCRGKLDKTEVEVREFVAGLREEPAATDADAPPAATDADAPPPDDEGQLPF